MSDYTFSPKEKSIHVVIFTGGNFPAPADTASYWKSTGSPDVIIAADSGLETERQYESFFRKEYDFSPDLILGDFDSISSRSILSDYQPEIIEHFPQDKDWTDTELAVERAYETASAKSFHPYITLVGGDGGRADHFIGIYDTFSAIRHPHTWLLTSQKIIIIEKGITASIQGLRRCDVVSIARTSSKRTGGSLSSHGLAWESNVFRKEGMPSISNRISSEYENSNKPVTITSEEGSFLLIVPLSADVILRQKECSLFV